MRKNVEEVNEEDTKHSDTKRLARALSLSRAKKKKKKKS